jgi:hypothetical protein
MTSLPKACCFAVIAALATAITTATAWAAVQSTGDTFVVSGKSYSVVFSAATGAILAVRQGANTAPILRSGDPGLWQITFRDGTTLNASAFSSTSPDHAFRCEADPAANALRMTYSASEATVVVTATGRDDSLDLAAVVSRTTKPITGFALPGRLRFDPARIDRFISPMNAGESVGIAFLSSFFKPGSPDRPAGWANGKAFAGEGYGSLYGGSLNMRPVDDPAVHLTATPDGRKWLGDAAAVAISDGSATVNRPPAQGQSDLVLVDSPNGPFFSASHLGGAGYIFRVGGPVFEPERALALNMIGGALDTLAASAPPGRTKIGLLSVLNGPASGGWAAVPVTAWADRLRSLRSVASGRATFVELPTPKAALDAMASGDFLAVVNPYGEQLPAPEPGSLPSVVAAIGKYVRAGGNWFETGGFSFFYELDPTLFRSYGTSYPSAFADFQHLDTRDGSVSVFGVQPMKSEPWAGAANHAAIFVPGNLACGGDEQGGWADRSFAPYIAPGDAWTSPAVRLSVGHTAPDDLRAYSAANLITRRLEDKMKPDVLAKFRQSVMVYYAGYARDKIANLSLLPVPTLIHFADYLHGGFDKQYPDHLPPSASFGTPAEMREFFDRAHALGHLVMPYTNPTWWCDHPRGPTFEAAGDAPLSKGPDGKPYYEKYGPNDGWTITFWDPAVQAANRKTVRQFTDEYPVDVLFQDQNGARGWVWDYNPASPTPSAYTEGLLSQVAEDSRTKPLSTEGGWDRAANYESQLCGMAWAILPGGSPFSESLSSRYSPDTWEVFPLAEYIAHDKTSMIFHDLGQFITDRPNLAWALGLGFGMSYSTGATGLKSDATRNWLLWLDRIQKSICAWYLGEPVASFTHDHAHPTGPGDDGIVRAKYGPVDLVASLGPKPRAEGFLNLAPYGFWAQAPGRAAGNVMHLAGVDATGNGFSFVSEGDERTAYVWVYAPPQSQAAAQIPSSPGAGKFSVTFDGAKPQEVEVRDGGVAFTTPSRPGEKIVQPPAALAGKAPRDWPGAKPSIGIIDLGQGLYPAWTTIMPADWLAAFRQSPLATDQGVAIKRLTTAQEVADALRAGPTAWLAILNPYGEIFPTLGPDRWQEMLDLIRDYVRSGGSWWETAGHTFYVAVWQEGGAWATKPIGVEGINRLGVPLNSGAVEQPAEPVHTTTEGRAWLGNTVADTLDKQVAVVNRSLPHGTEDPGHVGLVAGQWDDYIGGYRLGGWGFFWRIGGFHPTPQVVFPAATGAMEYIFTHPPVEPSVSGISYLWHATVTAR